LPQTPNIAQKERGHNERLRFTENGKCALRDSLPEERANEFRRWFTTETLDNRRPLEPGPGPKSLPLVARLHPADPPLEPQGGRLHNLLYTARMNRKDQKI
jgi:hypothetical protein